MKKTISFALLIVVLLLGFQFLVTFFKTEHYTEYDLTIDGDSYSTFETYEKEKGIDYYLFEVSIDDKQFLFRSNNRFNKQKEVVQDIKSYVSNDLVCLSLIYIDNIASSPICYKDNSLYSYISLENDYDFNEFLSSLSSYGFEKIKSDDEYESYEDLVIYNNNLLDETVLVYNYKNIIAINKDNKEMHTFAHFDNYKNELGTLVGNYYMIPRTTESPSYAFYYAFDLTSDSRKEIEINFDISKQIYVNGVYNDKLYIFDKSNLAQYSIDPSNREIKLTGSTDKKAFLYQDGEEKEVSVYDLNNSNILFVDDLGPFKELEADFIYNFSSYAIVVKENNFYKVYKDHLENPILLFMAENAKEIVAKNEQVYYIQNDTIYRYSDRGIAPLIKREEFNYNYENIFDVYIKE